MELDLGPFQGAHRGLVQGRECRERAKEEEAVVLLPGDGVMPHVDGLDPGDALPHIVSVIDLE